MVGVGLGPIAYPLYGYTFADLRRMRKKEEKKKSLAQGEREADWGKTKWSNDGKQREDAGTAFFHAREDVEWTKANVGGSKVGESEPSLLQQRKGKDIIRQGKIGGKFGYL